MRSQYTPRTPYTCQHCGVIFFRCASRAEHGKGKHCSRACYAAHAKAKHTRPCARCGELFFSRNLTRLYCSQSCAQSVRVGEKAARWQGKTLRKDCRHCGQSFAIKASTLAVGKGKYCSRHCADAADASIPHACLRCGKEYTVIRSVFAKGRGRYCSRRCACRARLGTRAGGYRNGNATRNSRVLLRHRIEYKEWRNAVFRRDDWTCQHCGRRGGVALHAHHLKGWAHYPALRYEVGNGQTLCADCHGAVHGLIFSTR